jgi:hypothetical protein
MDLSESDQEESVDLLGNRDFEARVIGDRELWDGFVDASPGSTLFHKWDFLRIVEKHTGYKLYPYGIFADGRLRCVFPLYFRREFGVGIAYSAPPAANLPYLGFVTDLSYDAMGRAENEQFMYGIAGKIDACVSALSANYAYIQTVPEVLDVRPLQQNGFHAKVGFDYYIDLLRPLDEIWDSFGKECKRDIRHQEMKGLEIRQSDDVDKFYGLMRDRFTSIGMTTFFHRDQNAYVKEAVNAFPDHMKMLYVCHQGNVEGAAINYSYNNRYLLWMGCASGKFNDYLMWETIKEAKNCGMKQIKNPGADIKRLTMFKSKFNPSLETIYTFYTVDPLGELARNSLSAIKRVRSVKEAILT